MTVDKKTFFFTLLLSLCIHIFVLFCIRNNIVNEKINEEKISIKMFYSVPEESNIKNISVNNKIITPQIPVEKPVEKLIEKSVPIPENTENDFVLSHPSGEGSSNPPANIYSRTETNKEADSNYNNFLAGINQKINNMKEYPRLARKKEMQGTVTLEFQLDSAGNLEYLEILKSSGYSLLDRAALSIINDIVPFKHSLGRTVKISVPIVYSFID